MSGIDRYASDIKGLEERKRGRYCPSSQGGQVRTAPLTNRHFSRNLKE